MLGGQTSRAKHVASFPLRVSLTCSCQIMESTYLIPMYGDVAKIVRKAEGFKDLDDALQRNLQVYLPLTMDSLAAVHQSVKASAVAEATR